MPQYKEDKKLAIDYAKHLVKCYYCYDDIHL